MYFCSALERANVLKNSRNYMLNVHNATVTFSGEDLFSGITFKLDRGDRVGLIGKNGAGKSTMLKILSKEMEPDTGQIAADKAAAERQAKLDELSRRNIESQIEVRERPAGAVSAAGKFATDMGFTPGTKEHIAAMQNYIKKEKATELTALQKEAAAIFPNDAKAAAAWVKDRRERPRGTVQKAGVVLDESGQRVGRAIFNPTPKEGEGYVSVIDDSGKTRPLAANERSVEDALIKDLVISIIS